MKPNKLDKYLRVLSAIVAILLIIIIILGGELYGRVRGKNETGNPINQGEKWEDRHFKEIDDILADINSVLDDSCNSSGNQVIDLGSYKITAFCPCAICCGEWAKNRQDGIVVGAHGIELVEGVSVAAPFPKGTRLHIDGVGEYVVHDKPADWVLEENDHKLVDIYFNYHEDAVEFGAKHKNVYLVGGE